MGQYLVNELCADPIRMFEIFEAGTSDGWWIWDLEEPENMWISGAFWRLLGYAREGGSTSFDSWRAAVHGSDLVIIQKNLQAHFAELTHPFDQTVRYRHQDGSLVPLRTRGIAILDSEGLPSRLVGGFSTVREYVPLEDPGGTTASETHQLGSLPETKKMFDDARQTMIGTGPIGLDAQSEFRFARAIPRQTTIPSLEDFADLAAESIVDVLDEETEVEWQAIRTELIGSIHATFTQVVDQKAHDYDVNELLLAYSELNEHLDDLQSFVPGECSPLTSFTRPETQQMAIGNFLNAISSTRLALKTALNQSDGEESQKLRSFDAFLVETRTKLERVWSF